MKLPEDILDLSQPRDDDAGRAPAGGGPGQPSGGGAESGAGSAGAGAGGQADSGGEAGVRKPRSWISVYFECCHVYSRVYMNAEQTAYVGWCPKCAGMITVLISPDGSPDRFFRAG